MVALYPDQERAVAQMHNGCILCGMVGSGKSLTALTYFKRKFEYLNIQLYIICTAKKRDDLEWEKELARLGWSTDINRSYQKQKVIIDSWNNIQKYESVQNAFFMFDEQRVCGSGKWSKTFIKIAKNNKWILLSATPGDNWMDYAPVFIANGFYKNRTQFIREHVVYSRYSVKFPKIERYIGEAKLEHYRQLLLVNIDVPKNLLKDIHKSDIKVSYNKDLTKRLMDEKWNFDKGRPIKNISELCFYMRKISNSDMSRLSALNSIKKKYDRLIVFYNFDYELEILREYCKSNGIVHGEWNGSKHDSIPETDSWIYLVQYTAGCEGWNCTMTNAILFYSLSYSYKQMEQASGRINRRDSNYSDLYYYYLLSDSPIDKAIDKCLKRKKTFNSKMFERSQNLQML